MCLVTNFDSSFGLANSIYVFIEVSDDRNNTINTFPRYYCVNNVYVKSNGEIEFGKNLVTNSKTMFIDEEYEHTIDSLLEEISRTHSNGVITNTFG